MITPQYSGPISSFPSNAMMINDARSFLRAAQLDMIKELAKPKPTAWKVEGLQEAIDASKEQLEVLGAEVF